MQTTQAVILSELARWEQAQKELEAVLMMEDLTVANYGRLKRVQELVTQETAKYKAALVEYPNVN